ncbi:amidohydrolase [Succinivibrio dextrinosolvens]|uniref:amidohydrolase n=1 Tax=Succinivibrio dextrinosolvens TaxID=83771 RepID=UPI0008E06D86|nr:amidohydrolase [Succinivibrio dextrinosolvens]SFS88597.1 amidohydrolase [Succinivibrio dextrinosolvens]
MNLDIKEYIEKEFYYLHQHPELSYREFKTTERLRQDLVDNGIEILPYNLETGLVGSIGSGDKTVAIRADIDALPILEEAVVPYKSLYDGVMHACGHDSHAAIILGAALLLKQQEALLKGKVRVIFQPAEEAPGGARKIIEAGVLDKVSAIFGIHSAPIYDVGTLGITGGPTHAAVEKFELLFEGNGTHAAHPNLGKDTVLIASHFITAVQSIVSREIDPIDSAVVSVTHIQAGNTWNVIPQSAFLEGTIRTYTRESRILAKQRFEELAKGIASTFGIKVSLKWTVELPATFNDYKLEQLARTTALEEGFIVEDAPRSLGGEDFSLYQEKIPGFFVLIGTGKTFPNHNPKFRISPEALYPAAKYVATLVRNYLES